MVSGRVAVCINGLNKPAVLGGVALYEQQAYRMSPNHSMGSRHV